MSPVVQVDFLVHLLRLFASQLHCGLGIQWIKDVFIVLLGRNVALKWMLSPTCNSTFCVSASSKELLTRRLVIYFKDSKMLSLTQTSITLVTVLFLWTVAFGFCFASHLIQPRDTSFASKHFSTSPWDYVSSHFKSTVLFFSFLT